VWKVVYPLRMWLTRQEAAAKLRVSARTLYNWERSGKIRGYKKTLPNGSYRIRYKTEDVEALLNEQETGEYPVVDRSKRPIRWPWKKGRP